MLPNKVNYVKIDPSQAKCTFERANYQIIFRSKKN